MDRVRVVQAIAGESFRAWLIRCIVFPLIGFKRAMRGPERFMREIARQQKHRDTGVDPSLRRRYAVKTEKVGGFTVHTVSPKAGAPRGVMLYLHGSAYVANMSPFHWLLVKGLITRTGARIVVPLYPLAPEHDWCAGYAMMDALYAQLLQEFAPEEITICGDSAGGGLSLGFAQALRDSGRPLPGRLILFSPWLNLSLENPRQEALEEKDAMLARPGLNWGATCWAGGAPVEDPHISPIFGSLNGLPPMLVFTGGLDLLYADAQELLEKARAEDVALEFVEAPRMTHAWSSLPVPEAHTLYDMAAAFVRNGTVGNPAS